MYFASIDAKCLFILYIQIRLNLNAVFFWDDSLVVDLLEGGEGPLSTCTYGEVSPIFLGQDIAKNDIFESNEN